MKKPEFRTARIRVDPIFYKHAKAWAAKKEMSLQDLFNLALEEYLKQCVGFYMGGRHADLKPKIDKDAEKFKEEIKNDIATN